MWDYLQKLDIYGQSIEFTVNKNRKFRTPCGFIASVFTLLSMLVFGIMEVITNNEPSYVEFHKYYDKMGN